jgi:hypothetical protein
VALLRCKKPITVCETATRKLFEAGSKRIRDAGTIS